MTDALELWQSHRYDEAIIECERELAANPNDMGSTGLLARAYYSKGEYTRALPLLELVDKYERSCKATPGHIGRQLWISCAHWLLGDRPRGMEMMHRVVQDSPSAGAFNTATQPGA